MSEWTCRSGPGELLMTAVPKSKMALDTGSGLGIRVTVTGATSDFAKAILPRLCNAPGIAAVLGLGRRACTFRHEKFTYAECDIRDPGIGKFFVHSDVVVHLAFAVEELRDKALMNDINVGGSINVISAAHRAGVKQLIVASSANAYGNPADHLFDETYFPAGDRYCYYAYDKAEVEHYIAWWQYRNPGAMRIVILRPTYVVGREFYNDGIDAMTSNISVIPNAATARFQFLHRDDLAEAFYLAITQRLSGTYNIGPEGWTPVVQLARAHGQRLFSLRSTGIAKPIANALYRLRLLKYSAEWVTNGDPLLNSNLFRAATGWRPSLTSDEAATLMVLYQGRPIVDPAALPRRRVACEKILEPSTEYVREALAADPDLANLFDVNVKSAAHVYHSAGNQTIHVERHSPIDPAREIIVVPAPGTHARFYSHIAGLTDEDVAVSIVDPPGVGLSTGSRGYRISRTVRAVRMLADEIALSTLPVTIINFLDVSGSAPVVPELLSGPRCRRTQARAYPDAVNLTADPLNPTEMAHITRSIRQAVRRAQ